MYIQEVNTGVYAWDLADIGADTVVSECREHLGINSLYMVALMHYEKRPFTNLEYYPHNPVRKEYLPEDARCYWKPDPEAYKDSRIKPQRTSRDFLKNTDWVDVLTKEARKQGIGVGMAISHTPLDYARSTELYPDVTQRDVYGNRLPGRWGQVLCHYSEDARTYARSIAYDLAKNHDIDYFMPSFYLYNPGRLDIHPVFGIALGTCFCPNCEKAAKAQGLPWDEMKAEVKKIADWVNSEVIHAGNLENAQYFMKVKASEVSPTKLLLEHPLFFEWLRFRQRGVAGMFKAMRDGVKAANPKVGFRFNQGLRHGDTNGLDLHLFAEFCDSFRVTEYSEQVGDMERLRRVKPAVLTNVRREVGDNLPVLAAVAIRPKGTPELIKEGIKVAARCGMDGLSFAFYDCASYGLMKAAKDGMAEAEVYLAPKK
jgi:hypothetical protein